MSAFTVALVLLQLPPRPACSSAVQHQLDQWGATDEVLKAPSGPLGGDLYRIATRELGVWITYHRPRGLDRFSIFRSDARGTIRLDFDSDCEPTNRTSKPGPSLEVDRAFTDAHLKDLLDENPTLVVYLWSPHLPLSADGYHEIARAASSLSARLVAVVDASAEPTLTARVADEVGIPESARRPLRSVELLFRDLAVHPPSVLVFADGKASAPLPGYRNRDAYRRYLSRILTPLGDER